MTEEEILQLTREELIEKLTDYYVINYADGDMVRHMLVTGWKGFQDRDLEELRDLASSALVD